MATTRQDIERWFKEGLHSGKRYMIVVCDTFEYDVNMMV